MPKKVLLNDPTLNEFIYDVIHTATIEQRKKLRPDQQLKVKTPKTAKRYAAGSTVDEKLDIIRKMGMSYALLLFPSGLFTSKSVKDLFKKYDQETPEKKANAILQDKVFAVTDRQVTVLANLMANISHGSSFMLNRDFHKIGHHVLNWEEPENELIEATIETLEYVNPLSKLMLNSILGSKPLSINRVGNDLDINILLYLLNRRGRYVNRKEIDSQFKPYYKLTTITSSVKRLLEGLYIDKNPLNLKEREYMIIALGIEEAMSFIKKTMNQTLNF